MIKDYADLVAEVSRRSGVSDVANRAGQFVGLAEAYIRKALRIGSVDLISDFDGLEGADTNWLLEEEPQIYLCAVLHQVYLAEGDFERAAAMKALADQLLATLAHDAKLLAVNGAKISVKEAPA